MADKLKAGWTPEFEKGMKRLKSGTHIEIISGPSSKPNPVLQKYEVHYAELPNGEYFNKKKHKAKIKFFTNKTEANTWVEDVTG